MRANLEDNLASGLRIRGSRYSTLETQISAPYRILPKGPHFYYFDPQGGTFQIFLPPLTPNSGQMYVIGNIGATGNLTIADDGGVTLFTPLAPGNTVLCLSSDSEWHISLFQTAISGGVPIVAEGVVNGNQLAGWSDSSGQFLRGVDVGTGLQYNTGVSPPVLSIAPDATGAPIDAEYIVGSPSGALSNERVLTDSSTVTWDLTVPGQVSAISSGGTGGGVTLPVTDNHIARYDGTTGVIQDSGVVISDAVLMSGAMILATGSPTPRLLEARAADVVNVLDYGAVPGPIASAADSSAAIQAAIDACPEGGTVFLPAPAGVQNVYRLIGSGSQCLLVSKAINIVGGGIGSVLYVDSSVPNTRDIIRIAPAHSGWGYSFRDFAIRTFAVPAGRHGLHFDISGSTTFLVYVVDISALYIGDELLGGHSIHLSNDPGTTSGGLAYSSIVGNNLESIWLDLVGDGVSIERNVIGTSNLRTYPTIRVSFVQGAGGFDITDNVITGRHGMIWIVDGTSPTISYNEFETPNGLSFDYPAIVDLNSDGTGGTTNAQLIGNQYSVLAIPDPAPVAVRVRAGCFDTRISDTRYLNQSGPHIIVEASAQNTMIDRNCSAISGPNFVPLNVSDASSLSVWMSKQVITADRHYFVDPAGNDTNSGISAAEPFGTLQGAWDKMVATDSGGFNRTIHMADGTYTNQSVFITKWWTGGGNVTFQGHNGSPASVVQSVTGEMAWRILTSGTGKLILSDFKIETFGPALDACDHIFINGGVDVWHQGMDFGAAPTSPLSVHNRLLHPAAKITILGDYTISGGTGAHWLIYYGVLEAVGRTVTVANDPNFTFAFVHTDATGKIFCSGTTFVDATPPAPPDLIHGATGKKFDQQVMSLIHTGGQGPDLFPGTIAGTTGPTSVYI